MMAAKRVQTAFVILLVLGLIGVPVSAGDHLDGPALDPGRLEADLNGLYVFQGSNPAATVLALTVSPAAGAIGPSVFGTDVIYQFNVVATPTNPAPFGFKADIAFRVVFDPPDSHGVQAFRLYRADGSAADGHSINPANLVHSGATDVISSFPTSSGDALFFAGLRSDPFFFDLGGWLGTSGEEANGRQFNDGMETDFFADLNTLAIVIELPDGELPVQSLSPYTGLAVWASTADATSGDQFDRVGRPLVNLLMNSPGTLVGAPTGNRDAFNVSHPGTDNAFEQAIEDALAALSSLDSEGPFDSSDLSLWTSVFAPDFLLFNKWDTSPAALPGLFRGRRLEDDVVDIILNITTGGNPLAFPGPRNAQGGVPTDGIGPHTDYLSVFPYLGNAHPVLKTLVPVILGGTGVVSTATEEAIEALTGTDAVRLAGLDRYSTAAAISQHDYPGGASIVFVAVGGDFPDALAGGVAAAVRGGPVLLVRTDSVPGATAAELGRLDPDEIVVLGGSGVVSDTVLVDLEAFTKGPVRRLAGADRFRTAVEISRDTFPAGAAIAYLAVGDNFPDALAGGVVAGLNLGPILLTQQASAPKVTIDELARLNVTDVVILGGQGVISNDVASQLQAALAGVTVQRVAGPDRYSTAASISELEFLGGQGGYVYIATGVDFPDALAGVPSAALAKGPILLVSPADQPPTPTVEEILRLMP